MIKRDDLIPFGFGGNKVRGLEWIVADALRRGADTLVTGAGVLSNHVRATAAAAVTAGLRSIAVYWGNDPGAPQGNHRLVQMLGADVVYTGSDDRASVDGELHRQADRLRSQGRVPYVIPRGGACPLGVLGHVLAAKELLEQLSKRSALPDVLILAAGSGGTLTGWLLGSKLFNAPWSVYGVSVSRPRQELVENVLQLAAQTAAEFDLDCKLRKSDVCVYDNYIGSGYGIPSVKGNRAIEHVARAEGVFLDPTYTGKAFACLSDMADEGLLRNKTTLFIHTGGEPALFVNSARDPR